MSRLRTAGPLVLAGGWRDDVTFMKKVLARLDGRVPGIRWVRPVAHHDPQLLLWDGGEHQEDRLGALADWADANWPPETGGNA
jgi:excinuclease UvrABC nuclease subunit